VGHRLFGASVLFGEVFFVCFEVPILNMGEAWVDIDRELGLLLEESEDVEDLFDVALSWRRLILREQGDFEENFYPA
jgi:hypothetical protein